MPRRVATGQSVAVTAHELATDAAIDTLDAGGTAVDAAVAANAVIGVVAPETCGIGGDLFALVHTNGIPAALNASGRSGSNASASRIRADGLSEMPLRTRDTITVPGCVDGWEALLQRFGRFTLAGLLAPAIRLANDGFPVSRELATALDRMYPIMHTEASASDLYPDGTPPAAGTTLRRPLLGATLEAIAANGRAAFYAGEPADAIVAATNESITRDDLHHIHADWVEPLALEVEGRTGWTIPPNSQGYITLGAWWIFCELEPPKDARDPAFHHALVEAYRALAFDRDDLVADPDHAPCEPKELLALDRLTARAAAIDRSGPTPWPEPGATDAGTTYLAVRDDEGQGVSLIQSNFHGVGAGLSAGETGVWLQNRGAGFSLEEGHPNELEPSKRPLHTLSPTIWTTGDRLELILGTRGGHQQPQLLLQVLAHHFHAGLDLESTQEQPRWTTSEWRPGATSRLLVEDGFPVARELAAMGHDVDPEPKGRPGGWGPIAMIAVGADGDATGAADPRVSTSSARARNTR